MKREHHNHFAKAIAEAALGRLGTVTFLDLDDTEDETENHRVSFLFEPHPRRDSEQADPGEQDADPGEQSDPGKQDDKPI